MNERRKKVVKESDLVQRRKHGGRRMGCSVNWCRDESMGEGERAEGSDWEEGLGKEK